MTIARFGKLALMLTALIEVHAGPLPSTASWRGDEVCRPAVRHQARRSSPSERMFLEMLAVMLGLVVMWSLGQLCDRFAASCWPMAWAVVAVDGGHAPGSGPDPARPITCPAAG